MDLKIYTVFLFNDILLWCRQPKLELERVDFLDELTFVDNTTTVNVISRTSNPISVIIVDEKENWIKLLNNTQELGKKK